VSATGGDVSTGADGTFVVRMLSVPLLLRERSRQHGADLLRETALVQAGQATGTAERAVPARLLELAHELDTVYGPYVAASTEQMEDALDRGEDTLDEAAYRLPSQAAAFVRRVADLLAEVEVYCREDAHLLTLAPPPDVAAYRRWAIEQVLEQHAGRPPTPWPVYAAEHGLS